MYCVIQKVINKKPNSHGSAKELKVSATTWTMEGQTKTHYHYIYSDERFERPIKDAYRISIHSSYRENGKVKKKQWVICTIGYYDITDGWTWIGDHSIGLSDKLEKIGITEEKLCELVYKKLDPIIADVKTEFEKTEEYNTSQKNKEIVDKYLKDKDKFEEKYGKDTYDYCYDIFGVLRNESYLKELEESYQAQWNYKSSYYESNYSNYKFNENDFSGYFSTKQSNYTEQEKEYLKVIYKAAALKLHPDIKKDNGDGMKFLNKLKDQWGI